MPKDEKQENLEKKAPTEDGVAEKRPGILTGQEIKKLDLVKQIGENCLKAASCDLRLGRDVFHCGQGEPKFLNLEEEPSKGVTIESLGMILFSTNEKVNLPKNIIGRFGLRISHVLEGLILQVGPQVEPGYEGPLFGVIFNTQGVEKTLMVDQRFLTIEFSRTSDDPDDELFKAKKIDNLHQFLDDQGTNIDVLAKPSASQNVQNYFKDCKYEHGLKIEGKDRIRRKSSLNWAKVAGIGVILAVLLSLLAIFVALFPDEIRSKLGIGQNQNVGSDSNKTTQRDRVVTDSNENTQERKIDSNDKKEGQL